MIITPLAGKVFGATISGVHLRAMGDAEFRDIYAALLKYGLLIFPDQHLTEAENIAVGERFGPLEFGALPIANQERIAEGQWGDVLDVRTRRMRTNVGNEFWHTDSTYMPLSSKCAMLSAVTVPTRGGETEFADARAAYAALDDATKARISTLSAYHSTQYSQAHDIGDFIETSKDMVIYHGEAYLRPLVKVHPETGVKNLFIGRHAFGIPGLSRDESRALLKSLLDHTLSAPERVYTHHWQAGETAIWDNRALLHRACAYDYSQPRVMIATRIAGDPQSELAYYPDDPRAAAGRLALQQELSMLKAARAL